VSASNGKSERRDLDDLKARVDLAELVRQSGVELKRTGKSWVGRCPFHDDSSASLSVNPEAQLWNCFGCEAGGDVFRFFQLREKCTFPQALERVRALAGSLPANGHPKKATPLPGQEPLPGGLARSQLLDRLVGLYARKLSESREAKAYLASRGLGDPELAAAFRLGYCDGSQELPAKGEVREALERVGLVTAGGRELFEGCLVVPLSHPELGTAGLYGRKLSPRARVKHLYLPGPKRGVFNWQALKLSPEHVFLTESILDALSVWAAGEQAVTCLYGAGGLPQDLDEALIRFGVRQVALCLDADEAGQKAAQSLAEQLTARGLHCTRIALPCKDPNQLLSERGPAALREALAQSDSFPGCEGPPAASATAASQALEDGFRWSWQDLTLTVTLHPPFRSRLRATLRVERGGVCYRHSLDLASYRARTQAGRDLARRFALEPDQVERLLLELVDEAERWVAAAQERQQDPRTARVVPAMSETEKEEALAFLQRPDLIGAILADMEAMGTVGEERAKLLAYLVGVSRKLERPLAGILGSQSGAGKSGITALVAELVPPEEVVFYSRLSTLALYNMESDYLVRKLVILEERVGAEDADYSIRTLISQHKLTQAVTIRDPVTGQQRTQENEVLGPIAYLETTTNLRAVHHENATRCFEIHLDESEEQTRRIHQWQRQRRLATGSQELVRETIRQRHHQAQRLLELAVVRIPFVEHLSFPTRWLRTRRDHERFLCLVEAVAFLHQHQRSGGVFADGTRYIDATPADYRTAFELAQQVLAATFHELSREARELLEAAQAMLAEPERQNVPDGACFTRKDLRGHTQWPDHRVRVALDELRDLEYVELVSGSQGRTCWYTLRPGASSGTGLAPMRELTTPEELERRLSG
jgi:DNA primase catalytic core